MIKNEKWKEKRIQRIIVFLKREGALNESREVIDKDNEDYEITIFQEKRRKFFEENKKYIDGKARIVKTEKNLNNNINVTTKYEDIPCKNADEIEFNKTTLNKMALLRYGSDNPIYGKLCRVSYDFELDNISEHVSSDKFIVIPNIHMYPLKMKNIARHNNEIIKDLQKEIVIRHYEYLDKWLNKKLTS